MRPPLRSATVPSSLIRPVNRCLPLFEASRQQDVVADPVHVQRERVTRLGRSSRTPPLPTRTRAALPPSASGAMKIRISSTSPASRKAPARRGPARAGMLWMSRVPSLERRRSRASASWPPAATTISAPAASRTSRGAAVGRAGGDQDQAHVVGGAHQLAVRGQARLGVEHDPRRLARRSRVRAVSSGSSASAVPMPTQIASACARQLCTMVAARAPRDPLGQSPVCVATLPSRVIADLKTTCGRPVRACLRERLVEESRGVRDLAVDELHGDPLVPQDAEPAAGGLFGGVVGGRPPRA